MPARRTRANLSRLVAMLVPLGAVPAVAQPASEPTLVHPVQLTFPERFARAGEAYFDPTANWIIFQAIERPAPGQAPSEHYAMYVAKLTRDSAGNVTGLDEPVQISAPGSANTCGWFHPSRVGHVLWGSTTTPPVEDDAPGYQRGTGRYRWQFPREMEVVQYTVPAIYQQVKSPRLMPDFAPPTPLWTHDGYDAEASWSKDGRYVLYTRVEGDDPDIWLYDETTGTHTPLIVAKGYDGGPFFSPDGNWICYRSDREGNSLLQLYVAELARDASGAITGVKREVQLTQNEHVNWAPFWDPQGGGLVYATSEIGHDNYEIFLIEFTPAMADRAPDGLRRARITNAPGFDGLPAFSPDGSLLMWTSQRGAKLPDEQRPSSQLWIARWDSTPLAQTDSTIEEAPSATHEVAP
ncbi:MAG: hypothetical protein RBS39_00260 [Phycisphaerales bacterium]|jgi:hypothetical protein|nr:hypothetical protein [Phycisphaerales bacterium]